MGSLKERAPRERKMLVSSQGRVRDGIKWLFTETPELFSVISLLEFGAASYFAVNLWCLR